MVLKSCVLLGFANLLLSALLLFFCSVDRTLLSFINPVILVAGFFVLKRQRSNCRQILARLAISCLKTEQFIAQIYISICNMLR